MSMEAAGLLLDFAGVEGESVPLRLAAAVESISTYGPDERAAVEVARVVAAGHFDAISTVRAQDLLDVLAAVVGVDMHAGREHRLVEDLAGLPSIVDTLEGCLVALPAPVSSKLRRRISELTKGRVAKVSALPSGDLVRLAEAIERAELAAARPVPPGPTFVDGRESEGPAGSGNAPAGPSPTSGEAA